MALLATSMATATATSVARADLAYIGYYHNPGAQVAQFTTTSTANESITGGSVFAPNFQPEGIATLANAPGSTSNEVFIVNASSGAVALFNPSGTMLSSNVLKDGSGNALLLSNAPAGMAISADGHDLYVAESGGNGATGVFEFDTVTGRLVNSLSFGNAHDVTFHNGHLYVTAYQGTTNANQGVWQFNSDLSGGTQIIAPTTANNLYHPTGMAFVGNTLYVGNAAINSSTNLASFVESYSLSGTTATLLNTYSDPTILLNPFGVTAGPDGNVYVSSLGDTMTNKGQVTEINGSTGALSTYIAYGADGGAAAAAPKYLAFASQATMYVVPEPASMTMMVLGLAGASAFGCLRMKKRAAAV